MDTKRIVIFGSGEWGMDMYFSIRKYKEVYAFFDNDANKWGTEVNDVPIVQPRFIKGANIVICVAKYYQQIAEQLRNLGYDENQIYFFDEYKLLLLGGEGKYDECDVGIREKPITLQFPITYKCNFDCVMCGMTSLKGSKEQTPAEIKTVLSDRLFEEVKTVSINGGEPFMRRDLIECIGVIIDSLPKLKEINFITNGFFTEKIVSDLQVIKTLCADNGIRIALAISVDGVDDMQDFHRRSKNAFLNAQNTYNRIRQDSSVDSLSVICTITRYNIERINEVVFWANNNDIYVNYNIATLNKRISNEDRVNDFSVFSDEHARMLAQEFFYGLYSKTKEERYYGLFLFLRERKRYMLCPHQRNDWITLLPDGGICFCAARSKVIGNALEKSAQKIVEENIMYLSELLDCQCEECAQYSTSLNKEGKKELYNNNLKNKNLRWEYT